jgi:hypothetical protein
MADATEITGSEVRAATRVGSVIRNEVTGIRYVVIGFDRDDRAILALEGSSMPALIMSFNPLGFHLP